MKKHLLVALPLAFLMATPLMAEDCPPGVKSCKVVTISDDELNTLTGPNMIFDMATWASRPLGDIANAWRKKIESAPNGTVKADTPPPAPTPVPAPQGKK